MMERAMRRKDRQLSEQEAREILKNGEYGILSTVDDEGVPYGTPLSYAAEGDCIWFHCARQGHKLDNLRANPNACFTVVGMSRPVYAGDYTTYFSSAVAFGQAARVEEDDQKIRALRLICEKYLPDHMDKFEEAIAKSLKVTDVWEIRISHITGKAKAPK